MARRGSLMPRSHPMQNSSLKWSWWILNEEFSVLLGIRSCQSELPAGIVVTPGSGYSGAFVGMSAACCPRPAAVVTAPPLKQSLYLPVPPFFVSVLPLLLWALQGPHTQPGLLPCCIPTPLIRQQMCHRDPGVPRCPCATAPPVNTTRAQFSSPSWLE
ncbi:hypothetical protein Nmel_009446 [Mimus melanotis]